MLDLNIQSDETSPVSRLGRARADVQVLVCQSITSTEVVTTVSPPGEPMLVTPPATMILVRPASE